MYMKRYQVYLNPESVSILDEFGDISNISRSKVIQRAIDGVAEQLLTVVKRKTRKRKTYYALDNLVGFIDIKSDKPTHFAEHIDDIYLRD